MNLPPPDFHDLVLLGGGHANIQLLKKFAMKPVPGVRLTLITDVLHAPYSGMLPGYLAGFYRFDEIHFDLVKVAGKAGVRLLHQAAKSVDPRSKTVALNEGRHVAYDTLAINAGCVPILPEQCDPAVVLPLKPISGFLKGWHKLLERLKKADAPQFLAVVGGGAAGCEIAAILQNEARKQNSRSRVLLVEKGHTLLPSLPQTLQQKMQDKVQALGVEVLLGQEVVAASPGKLLLRSGGERKIDCALWATGADAPQVVKTSELPKDERGFVRVDATLAVSGEPDIFAVGDCVAFPGGLPKAGVFSVRQGGVLEENIRRKLRGQALRPYLPQTSFLSLITAGDKSAYASRGQYWGGGRLWWRWKDKIDRKFMQRWQDFPPMTSQALSPQGTPITRNVCGGCGAKVSADILRQTLKDTSVHTEDAAVIQAKPRPVLESVDFLRGFLPDPYLFARVAVLHALSDIYAMGAKAISAQAIVQIADATGPIQARDFATVMQGVKEELSKEAVPLVGGHTSLGLQLQLGFAVCGVPVGDRVIAKSTVKAGDQLILTKCLGSGTLLAKQMIGKLSAADYESLLKTLLQTNRLPADLNPALVSAMTDVTGFGLAGHLWEMLEPNGLGADIKIDRLPLLPGFELLPEGERPTLWTGNRDALVGVVGEDAPAAVFDPQTNGGLLLSVPEPWADKVTELFNKAGCTDAAIVGLVVERNTDQGARAKAITFG